MIRYFIPTYFIHQNMRCFFDSQVEQYKTIERLIDKGFLTGIIDIDKHYIIEPVDGGWYIIQIKEECAVT